MEFGGSFAETLYGEAGLDSSRPVVHVGIDQAFLERYYRVMAEIEGERVGHQQVLSAMTVRIIAEVGVIPTRRAFRDTMIERAIERAKAIFTKSADASLNMPEGTWYFRRAVTMPADRTIESAVCAITADNDFVAYFNGKR